MSGLKSLLKYRFQPRDSEKIESANGNTTPEKNTPDVSAPETPPSQLSSPGSPVFIKGKKMVAAIDSSSDSSSSPWLSKANGIDNRNGAGRSQPIKRKYEYSSMGTASSTSSSPASSQNNSVSDTSEHEMKQKVTSLKSMFPGCALWMLEDAAVATSDLEAAIDLIISRNRIGNATRPSLYQNLSSQSSVASSSSDIKPLAKRARMLLSSDSSDQNSQDTGQTPVISPTENMGSIKAIQAARQASRIRRDVMYTSDDEDGKSSSPASRTTNDRKKVKIDLTGSSSVDANHDVVEVDDSDDSDEDHEEKDADPIMKFFQDAELEELMTMPGCSKKKAEAIVECRPYSDWSDLIEKFNSQKTLNLNLVSGCKELIKIRSTVNRLMKHCEQIAQDMESIVSTLTSKVTVEQGEQEGYITRQPDLLDSRNKLQPYQLVGLNWLTLMHRQQLNGILADEMGLGKTIQTVAFLAQLLQDGEKGPHVIIAPSSTIDNWLRELKKWCPKLRVILYYGTQEERRELRADIMEGPVDFHVIVTSYNMATGGIEDRVLFKKFKFHYAIFDEGHMLKNMSSLRYQNLMKIRAQRRLLLTGTPLQNNLVELMSLLCFVMPEMFCGKTDHLKKMFTAITAGGTKAVGESKGSYERECVKRAKHILKPFFLRRIKSQVMQQLPRKEELLEHVPLVGAQQNLYEELTSSFKRCLELSSALDNDLKSRGGSMVMELRKAANHHLLHRRNFTDEILRQIATLIVKEPSHRDANEEYVFEDMQVMSDFELDRLCNQHRSLKRFKLPEDEVMQTGKFKYLDILLAKCKAQGSRVLLFSQFTMMLDIIEVYMTVRGHQFLRLDGSTPVVERQEMIDQYNQNNEIFIFLLSTRAGGLGINLTAADTVVIHDIDFNPYNDKQAEDRCHRLGQTKTVKVHRLVGKGTFEEAMYRCAQGKLMLEQEVTGQGSQKDDSERDMANLLKEALGVKAK